MFSGFFFHQLSTRTRIRLLNSGFKLFVSVYICLILFITVYSCLNEQFDDVFPLFFHLLFIICDIRLLNSGLYLFITVYSCLNEECGKSRRAAVDMQIRCQRVKNKCEPDDCSRDFSSSLLVWPLLLSTSETPLSAGDGGSDPSNINS